MRLTGKAGMLREPAAGNWGKWTAEGTRKGSFPKYWRDTFDPGVTRSGGVLALSYGDRVFWVNEGGTAENICPSAAE